MKLNSKGINQRNESFRFSDFNATNAASRNNNFDDDFLKTFQTQNNANKINEFSKNEDKTVAKKSMWNSSLSDYSENGNDLIENESNDILSQVSTPKIRDRF